MEFLRDLGIAVIGGFVAGVLGISLPFANPEALVRGESEALCRR